MAFLNQSQASHRWWRVRRICLAGLCAWAVFSVPAAEAPPADAQQTKVEYGLKAGLMFRFAQFVVWPARAFADAQAPIVVGVLGENPFESLDGFLSEKVDGRSFVVRYYRTIEEVKDCHILFISRSETPRFEAIMAQLKGRPILTVGDVEAFTRAGGMLRFDIDGGKPRLRVNFDEAKANGVTISSKIGRMATIVTKEKG